MRWSRRRRVGCRSGRRRGMAATLGPNEVSRPRGVGASLWSPKPTGVDMAFGRSTAGQGRRRNRRRLHWWSRARRSLGRQGGGRWFLLAGLLTRTVAMGSRASRGRPMGPRGTAVPAETGGRRGWHRRKPRGRRRLCAVPQCRTDGCRRCGRRPPLPRATAPERRMAMASCLGGAAWTAVFRALVVGALATPCPRSVWSDDGFSA